MRKRGTDFVFAETRCVSEGKTSRKTSLIRPSPNRRVTFSAACEACRDEITRQMFLNGRLPIRSTKWTENPIGQVLLRRRILPVFIGTAESAGEHCRELRGGNHRRVANPRNSRRGEFREDKTFGLATPAWTRRQRWSAAFARRPRMRRGCGSPLSKWKLTPASHATPIARQDEPNEKAHDEKLGILLPVRLFTWRLVSVRAYDGIRPAIQRVVHYLG